MTGRSLWIVVLAAALAAHSGWADEPPAAAEPEADAEAARVAAAIERMLDVIDLILKHHIQAPTRPELLRHIAASAHRRVDAPVPSTIDDEDLADECTDRTDRDESRQFLAKLCTTLAPLITAANERAAKPRKEPEGVELVRRAARPRTITCEDLLLESLAGLAPGEMQLIPGQDYKVQEQFQANRYVGIGVTLSGTGTGYMALARVKLFANRPAADAGALDGDLIESIDGESMKGVEMRTVVDRLRGPEGTKVTLVVHQPTESSRTLTITRGVIPRDTVHGFRDDEGRPYFRVNPTTPIACVRIGEIGGSTVNELRQIEQKLAAEGAQALVLDLRDIPRGAPHFAALLADALLDGGSIGRIRTKARAQELTADRECLFRRWPLAVLVNADSSNTAVWVAAALQDNRRAVIVGQAARTEAFVYTGFPMPGSDDFLLLATGILERPSGRPLVQPHPAAPVEGNPRKSSRSWGIEPDHVTSPESAARGVAGSTAGRYSIGTLNDPLLNKAVELLNAELTARQPSINHDFHHDRQSENRFHEFVSTPAPVRRS